VPAKAATPAKAETASSELPKDSSPEAAAPLNSPAAGTQSGITSAKTSTPEVVESTSPSRGETDAVPAKAPFSGQTTEPSEALREGNPSAQSEKVSASSPETFKKVLISILGAKKLRNADWSLTGRDKSDPYCICKVRGKPETQFQTEVVKDNLDPTWNSVMEASVKDGDFLDFEVFDEDPLKKDDFLGKVSLPAKDFKDKGFDGVLDLADAGKDDAKLIVKISLVP